MNRHYCRGRHRGRWARRRRGPIKRVVRGLADAFGIPRGMVIAGFVLGFVFIPLPAVLVFLAALYWVDNPERARRHVDSAFDALRRTGDRLRRSAAGSGAGRADRGAHEPSRPHVDPASLARRFERAERRTRAIEEFVASEEFRLNREFRRMERE
ncbi:MAG: hypothetical protein OXC25_09970 [Thiotrichales bacterium]|nr:hypothetical protein [Thiotrichales bacterium]